MSRRSPQYDLFNQFATFPALLAACNRAAKGKRNKPGVAAFLANREHNLLKIEAALQEGRWHPGRYTEILVKQPKERHVSAAPFADRVVHHAVCAIIAPILERSFIHHSYANRTGKGTHKAVAQYERYRNNHAFVLRSDIYRYFPSIDHEILKRQYRRWIGCERTLAVMDAIVDGSNPQEPVNLYFPGDDVFTPFDRRRGLPIGNLTSQIFANAYLDGMDHYITEVLHSPYLRYVDDFALFSNSHEQLVEWQAELNRYLCGRRLILHPKKTFVAPTAEPACFLGFELWFDGRRRLPGENVRRFRNRLRGLRARWKAGTIEAHDVVQRVNGWVGHALHANTALLRHAIFKGGWFDPFPPEAWSTPWPACCAAAPGITTHRTCAPPTATTTRPPTGTTTLGSVLPVQPRSEYSGS